MRNPSLYQEIEKDLKRIARGIFKGDDQFMEEKWLEIKRHIEEVADYMDKVIADRKKRDREEKRELRRAERPIEKAGL